MSRRAVFILGPHRSGTSLVAAAAEALGLSLGHKTDWVNEDNPKGFFENADITPFNDRLLRFLDSRWDNPLFHGRTALEAEPAQELEPWYREAEKIVADNFAQESSWAVKDPRICVLLPFWHEVLRRCGYAEDSIYHVYVLRNPVETARSQQKRHRSDPEFHFLGETLEESLALWYAYSLQGLEEAMADNNICVDYQEFLDATSVQLTRLAAFLGMSVEDAVIGEFAASFVDRRLHRQRAGEDDWQRVAGRLPFVGELYSGYRELAQSPRFAREDTAAVLEATASPRQWIELSRQVARLYPRAYYRWQDEQEQRRRLAHRHEDLERRHRELGAHQANTQAAFDNLKLDFDHLVEQNRVLEENRHVLELNAERLRVNLDIAENDLVGLQNVNDELRNELAAVYGTTSWRWTWPLRLGSALARRDRKTLAEELTRAHARITGFRANVAERHPRVYRTVVNPLMELGLAALRRPLKKFYLAELEELATRGGLDPRSGERAAAEDQRGFHPSERFLANPAGFAPEVTVVVPNYNHAGYLRKRLDSIYGQAYANFRVLLLDDCSSDDSRQILEEYAARYPEKTRTLFNTENSGNVFRQWAKGIDNASSDLVWIAESDDYCDPDFLEKLVPWFRDEAVKLAYAHSVFVDEQDAPASFTFEQYVSDIGLEKWQQSYVETAHHEVASALGQKNTIPNVSCAVFRKGGMADLLGDEKWLGMKICGDWIFYLRLIRGGKIAYSAETNNYYRFHAANTSASTYSRPAYYAEHEAVACEIARLYKVPEKTLQAHQYFVERFFLENAADLIAAGTRFESLYDPGRIEACRAERLPNVLIAAYAFSTGGGEVFPIRLAAALSEAGYGVTFFNFNAAPLNANMRGMLPPEIPVVELAGRFPGVDNTLEAFGIEVVHTHHASVDHFFSAGRLRTRDSVRQVVTMHGMYEAMDPAIFRANVLRMAGKIDHWVYIADKNLAPFRKHDMYRGDRFTKIANGMSRPLIESPDRSELGIPDDAFVVCLASRALPEKGWREAVRITTEARRLSGKDVHLVLLGDGPVYDELRREQLPAHVHLLGFRRNAVDYYAMSDVGLLPTRFAGESFPLTVIECFMAGRPVIATDVGEVSNMMTGDNGRIAGFLFELDGGSIPVAEVAEKLAALAADANLYRDKQQAAEAIAPRFEMSEVLADYAAVYAQVTAGERSGEVAPVAAAVR